MQLVKPRRFLQFVALSYMWETSTKNRHVQLEKSNLGALQTSGGIKNILLPKIISDTVSLCKDLGEKYLWVDRLCNIQDDAESKHGQIRDMGKIYGSVAFTIIIAVNNRDGKGTQNLQVVQDGLLFGGHLTIIRLAAEKSVHMEWTFQERVISTRRLFITEYQVIFESSDGQAHQERTYFSRTLMKRHGLGSSLWEFYKRRLPEEERNYRLFPLFIYQGLCREVDYNLRPIIPLSETLLWMQDYTSRQLTYRSDILHAFNGVGNSLQRSLGSMMLIGLPEKYLAQALMWSCLRSDGVIPDFDGTMQIPSRSWASSTNKFAEDIEKIASLVSFYFQDPEFGFRKLHVEER
ncbi:heterokaryon incompatibility protein-domain-containing protein [Halenospora varia]|nr:heterokaryon incompatibility protein-domain-containing protein [Halenospora varia]